MTADQFRQLALSLPDTSESSHMNHPDFRVNGKIFATLGYPDAAHAVVILPPDEQRKFLEQEATAFSAATGAWGARGATKILLSAGRPASVRRALGIAWQERSTKKRAK
jgi:hypothetical protein